MGAYSKVRSTIFITNSNLYEMFLFALREYIWCLLQCFISQKRVCFADAFIFSMPSPTFISSLLESQSGAQQEAEGNGDYTKGQRPYKSK